MSTAAEHERLERATEGLEPPFALLDLDAMWQNARDMVRRGRGKRLRVASKSVRCRAVLERVLAFDPAYHGLMTFTLPETLWLAEQGHEDLLLAYPTADRVALRALAALDAERGPVLMVDSAGHLDLMDAAAPPRERVRPLRLCIEADMGYHALGGRMRFGPKRSPLRTPAEVAALAREIAARPGYELVGLMGYEGHIAGVGDQPPGRRLRSLAIKAMQRASRKELADRRAEIVAALRQVTDVELVNGGGTGSLESTCAEEAVTEATVGSGLYAPALFDHYSAFTLRPAALFALPVVRRPGRGVATALGGGYLSSGPADALRLPVPHLPAGLRLDPLEGAGEVQTPLLGGAADALRPGDRVYLRHSKAGELCERFDSLLLLEADRIVDEVPTYRGEGRTFL